MEQPKIQVLHPNAQHINGGTHGAPPYPRLVRSDIRRHAIPRRADYDTAYSDLTLSYKYRQSWQRNTKATIFLGRV